MSDLAVAQRLGRLRAQPVKAAYKRLFDSPDGKIVLAHIMKHGFVLRSTFVQGDPHETALNEGMRRMALSIIRYANIEEQYILENYEQIMAAGTV